MQIKFIPASQPPTLLRKISAALITLALASVMLIFSAAALILLLAVGLIGGVYLYWKLYAMRKQLQAQGYTQPGDSSARAPLHSEPGKGNIIEGEVVRVPEPADSIENRPLQRRVD